MRGPWSSPVGTGQSNRVHLLYSCPLLAARTGTNNACVSTPRGCWVANRQMQHLQSATFTWMSIMGPTKTPRHSCGAVVPDAVLRSSDQKGMLASMKAFFKVHWWMRSNVFYCARQHICYSAHMLSPVRPSVCPSVRLSHGWISQKRLKLGSRNFHHQVAPWL